MTNMTKPGLGEQSASQPARGDTLGPGAEAATASAQAAPELAAIGVERQRRGYRGAVRDEW